MRKFVNGNVVYCKDAIAHSQMRAVCRGIGHHFPNTVTRNSSRERPVNSICWNIHSDRRKSRQNRAVNRIPHLELDMMTNPNPSSWFRSRMIFSLSVVSSTSELVRMSFECSDVSEYLTEKFLVPHFISLICLTCWIWMVSSHVARSVREFIFVGARGRPVVSVFRLSAQGQSHMSDSGRMRHQLNYFGMRKSGDRMPVDSDETIASLHLPISISCAAYDYICDDITSSH